MAVCWNDARLSNAIFTTPGRSSACWTGSRRAGAGQTHFGWRRATRRQMLEVNRIEADPESPGFDSREQVIRHFEEMIGRELVALDWYGFS